MGTAKKVMGVIGYTMLALAPSAQILKTLLSGSVAGISLFWPGMVTLALFLIAPVVFEPKHRMITVGHLIGITINSINFLVLAYFHAFPAAP